MIKRVMKILPCLAVLFGLQSAYAGELWRSVTGEQGYNTPAPLVV